jgi:hypothetical protein
VDSRLQDKALILKAIKAKVKVDYKAIALQDVLDDLSAQSGITIKVLDPSFESISVRRYRQTVPELLRFRSS